MSPQKDPSRNLVDHQLAVVPSQPAAGAEAPALPQKAERVAPQLTYWKIPRVYDVCEAPDVAIELGHDLSDDRDRLFANIFFFCRSRFLVVPSC